MTTLEKNETKARRTYSRVATNVPAVLWQSEHNRYVDVRIRNMSKGGMCFTCNEPATVDTKAYIFIAENVFFSPEMLEDARQYEVKLKWRERSSKNSAFRVGAQTVSKSDTIYNNHARFLLGICDLCGHSKIQKQLIEGNFIMNLCDMCHDFYAEMPDGFKKYLVGNIY